MGFNSGFKGLMRYLIFHKTSDFDLSFGTMLRIEMGREIWKVEGIKRAGLLATDNIKVDLQGTGKRILNFAQDRGRWWKLQNLLMKFWVL